MKAVSRRAVVGSALSFVGGWGCAPPPAPPSAGDADPHDDAAPQPEAAPPAATAPAEGSAPEAAPAPARASCERPVAVVGRNHGHVLTVSDVDVLAATERTYAIRGSSDHDHLLVITGEEFRALGSGGALRKKTELGSGHRHRVLVRCQPAVLPPDMISACDVVIAGDDGHEVVIPESHVRGGVERAYDIQGVAGHTHTLRLRPDDFARLLAGEKLDLTTEYGAGHFHHAYLKYLG